MNVINRILCIFEIYKIVITEKLKLMCEETSSKQLLNVSGRCFDISLALTLTNEISNERMRIRARHSYKEIRNM